MNEFNGRSGEASVLERLIKEILRLSDHQRSILLQQLERETADRSKQGQRRCSREIYSTYVKFVCGNNLCWGHSRDISDNGMFIETDQKLSIGDALTLNLPNAQHDRIIETRAKVARTTLDGIGVVFL